MSDVVRTIKDICKVTKVVNDWSFDICGEKILVANYKKHVDWPGNIQSFGSNLKSDTVPEQAISIKLQEYIYKYFYSTGSLMPDLSLLKRYGNFKSFPEEQDQYMKNLSSYNTSINRYDPYWKVVGIYQDHIAVSKNEHIKEVKHDGYRQAHQNIPLQRGQYVNIFNKKEDWSLQPYFYYAYGNDQPSETEELIRFYFNFKASEMHLLIRQLTLLFNKYELPFTFKCLNHPDYYHCRVDAAVIYLEKRHYHLAWRLIKKSYDLLELHFNTNTPMFTYRIRPGLGFAENPGKGQSFGMKKSYAISQIIMKAYKQQRRCTEKEIIDVLMTNGTSHDQPYLNIDSGVDYSFIQN